MVNFPEFDSPTKIGPSDTAPPLSVIMARPQVKQKSGKDEIFDVVFSLISTNE